MFSIILGIVIGTISIIYVSKSGKKKKLKIDDDNNPEENNDFNNTKEFFNQDY